MKGQTKETTLVTGRGATPDDGIDVEEGRGQQGVRLKIDDADSTLLLDHVESGGIARSMGDLDGADHAVGDSSGVDGLRVHLAGGCEDESETAEEILQ